MAFIANQEEAEAWMEKHATDVPRVGEEAPEFELSDNTGENPVRLSDFRGERPVALIFGSFT